MSKIVICAREWSGSTGRYARRLVEHLELTDAKNDYQILLKPADLASYQPRNPRFAKVACPHKEYSFAEQIGLRKQLQQLQPDLVHFTMIHQPAWYNGAVVTTMQDLTTLRFRNPAKNPIVFWSKLQVYKWLNKRVSHKSKAIITPSEFVKNDVANYTGITPAKITVTLEAADTIEATAEMVQAVNGKQFLLYVGRPTPHKNLPRLVEAYSHLLETHPQLWLVLAGKKDKNYAKLETELYQKGLTQILFTDHVTEGQLRWLYEQCAAYVFPSLSEGFGLPGLEAMVHAAPVVSSNATCLPEIYGDAAAYFDPTDIADMTAKIAKVLDNQDYRLQLIAKGKARVTQYSWQRMAEQTLAVYQQALAD